MVRSLLRQELEQRSARPFAQDWERQGPWREFVILAVRRARADAREHAWPDRFAFDPNDALSVESPYDIEAECEYMDEAITSPDESSDAEIDEDDSREEFAVPTKRLLRLLILKLLLSP